MLYIFGGLPGVGKSTLSSALAQELTATYIRVDVAEQAMRDTGIKIEGPEGYMVCYAMALQNLQLGLDVVADTVNPIEITRQAWRNVAESIHAPYVEIEVICSDEREHRHRVEAREADIPGLVLPTWEQVINRHYEVWNRDHIVIDTANKSVAECMKILLDQLNGEHNKR